LILASPSYPRRRSWARWRLPLVVLMLTAAALGAQEPEAAPNEPKPTPSPAPYIAQSEVVAQAEIMSDQIAKISARLEANRVETIAEALAPLVARLEDKAPEVEQRRIDRLRLLPRQQLSQEWQTYRQRLTQWEQSLTSISQELERDRAGLQQAVELWDRSLDEARAAEAPAAVIDRMDSLLKRIRVTQERVKQAKAKALTVLDEVAERRKSTETVLERLAQAQSGIWARAARLDSPPLWAVVLGRPATDRGDTPILALDDSSALFADPWTETVEYCRREAERLISLVLVLLAAIVVLGLARHRLSTVTGEEEMRPRVAAVAARPLSAAVLSTLVVSTAFLRGMPMVLNEASVVLILLSWARLLPAVLRPPLSQALFALAGLFVANRYGNLLMTGEAGLRWLLLLEAGGGALVVLWALRQTRHGWRRGWAALIRFVGALAMLVFGAAFVANVVGALRLSEMLTQKTISSLAFGAVLYPVILVAAALVIVIMRRPGPWLLRAVERNATGIEVWLLKLVYLAAFLLWLDSTLEEFAIAGSLAGLVVRALTASVQIGNATLSAGKILTLVGVFVGTLLLSRFIRAVLEHDVFPRVTLPRGVPNAVSTVVRYTMVVAALILAPLAAGVDFSNLAFIAGGLGVGIGFGLQNVVANFVSGLILAFERPIQIGDTVEVGSFVGSVTSIGVRSSTIRTFDGADVVVPNSDLVSSPVVNWTLTDFMRRKRLEFVVAHGADPHRVLDLLATCADQHPEVLDDPSPQSLFEGFSDTGLRFTVQFWVPTKCAVSAPSELALAVYDALAAEAIEMPRQRLELTQPTEPAS